MHIFRALSRLSPLQTVSSVPRNNFLLLQMHQRKRVAKFILNFVLSICSGASKANAFSIYEQRYQFKNENILAHRSAQNKHNPNLRMAVAPSINAKTKLCLHIGAPETKITPICEQQQRLLSMPKRDYVCTSEHLRILSPLGFYTIDRPLGFEKQSLSPPQADFFYDSDWLTPLSLTISSI